MWYAEGRPLIQHRVVKVDDGDDTYEYTETAESANYMISVKSLTIIL